MAIYSLNHKPIGKTTHSSGTAGAHLRYISRAGVTPDIVANGVPADWREACRWIDQEEAADRSNARVADRLMVALPIELNKDQRRALVQEYLEEVTGNLVPWYAAIHQKGEDSHNPHAHILIRDRSLSDGRRVIQTSEKGSTQHFRIKWSESVNKALSRANCSQSIDHRSLKAQGIDRQPTRHRGYQKPQKEKSINWVEKIEQESPSYKIKKEMTINR